MRTEVRDGGGQLNERQTQESLVGVAESEDSQSALHLSGCRVEAGGGLVGGIVHTSVLPHAVQDRSVKVCGTRA